MTEIVSRAVQIAFAGLRSFVQALIAGAVAWLASLGVTLPDGTAAAVEIALTAVIFGAVVAGLRWLESVRGDQPWQRWARRIGAMLMLGTSALQPQYGHTVDGQIVASETMPLDARPAQATGPVTGTTGERLDP